MKISTKTRYGIRAMVDLTLNYKGRPVLIREIARRQEIPAKYLEHIMIELKKAGLVESIRGAKGGYLLTKKPATITIFDIVTVLEGSVSLVPWIENKRMCDNVSSCAIRDLWTGVGKIITDTLVKTSLNDLAEKQKAMEQIATYQI